MNYLKIQTKKRSLAVFALLVTAVLVAAIMATCLTASAQTADEQTAAVTGLTAAAGVPAGETDIGWHAQPKEQSDPAVITTLAAPELASVKDADENPLVYAQQAETCPEDGTAPTPVDVAIAAVPIVVTSTTADYFVLYVQEDPNAETTVDYPVLVKLGEAGTTTLSENVAPVRAERYRVEKYAIADPADVDGDCIDDITELSNLGFMNPVNPAINIAIADGAVAVPDSATLEAVTKVGFGASDNTRFGRFGVVGMDTDRPSLYFINENTHNHHQHWVEAVGLDNNLNDLVRGIYIYHPDPTNLPEDEIEFYFFFTQLDDYAFSTLDRVYTMFAASMPLFDDSIAFWVTNVGFRYLKDDLPRLLASRINLLFEDDVHRKTNFLPFNPGEGFGRLRALQPDHRPHPRDVVIYEALPNELPRVAGLISTVPQTRLSHVNLRAIQSGIPNAFIRNALDNTDIAPLIDGYVRYVVTVNGWELRAATPAEVEVHYESSRPTATQTPERDLSGTTITPLSDISFDDWTAFGVKAANVAVLGTLGFPQGTVPDGFAIPFYFYDEFMKAHGFYDDVSEMLANPDFQTDFEVQDDMLDDLRADIKDANTPQWILDALAAMHDTYPAGQSLRYRSSTNNEDLPGFNGAGLYDSKTQDPDETEEDGIDKSLKGVFASLWTFRAFTEREFHRIDHLQAAMGVLVHPNYSDELANGVAVSFDPVSSRDGAYYVNTQLGEDLVTNPEAHSVPEEILLYGDGTYTILGLSNLVEAGDLLMNNEQLDQLRKHLEVIHGHFEGLYNPAPGEPYAMEIEFKITGDDFLAIKQARPWVFDDETNLSVNSPILTIQEAGTGTFNVKLTAAPSDTVTVSVSSEDTGAATVSPAILTFTTTDWDTSQTLTVSGVNDTDGSDETIRISLSASGGSYTDEASAVLVYIADDDAVQVTVSFEHPSYVVSEGANVTVNLVLDADPQRGLSIPLTVTAQGGITAADYSGVPTTVTFNSGDTTKSFIFATAQDDVDDDGESVKIAFDVLPNGVSAGTNNETTISITDDDYPNVIASFGQPSHTVDEGSSATLHISLNADPERTLSIPLTVAGHGGASGDDYSGIPTSVTFTSGVTDQTFTFTAATDSVNDDGESVRLSLGALPTGVTAGVTAETNVSIIDTTETSEIPWSATLTVGSYESYVPGMLGYSTYGAGIGSLSAEHISLDGTNYQVMVLLQHAGGLYLVTRQEMPTDFTLHIEDLEFKASESSVPAIPAQAAYWWEIDEFQWIADHTVAASITVPDGASSLAERPLAPPTARFSHLPESHNGTNAITFRIYFYEDFPMSFKTLRDEALEVTNGRVTKAQRNTKGSSLIWNITVRPHGTDDMEISLPATQDCADNGALCTEDGRKLYNSVTITVPGP